MKKFFFPQRLLDSLADEGKVRLDGNVLTILSKDSPSFELEPAYRFARTADGGADPHGLVGQIKSEKDLKDMKAEVYLDSVIYRETAYQGEPGFIGEEQDVLEKLSDTELLARFLLETMK